MVRSTLDAVRDAVDSVVDAATRLASTPLGGAVIAVLLVRHTGLLDWAV